MRNPYKDLDWFAFMAFRCRSRSASAGFIRKFAPVDGSISVAGKESDAYRTDF